MINAAIAWLIFVFLEICASPIIVSGSANFSSDSTTQNDENMVLIKGDIRAADIYFTDSFEKSECAKLSDRTSLNFNYFLGHLIGNN